jgi:hypothetical protein
MPEAGVESGTDRDDQDDATGSDDDAGANDNDIRT